MKISSNFILNLNLSFFLNNRQGMTAKCHCAIVGLALRSASFRRAVYFSQQLPAA